MQMGAAMKEWLGLGTLALAGLVACGGKLSSTSTPPPTSPPPVVMTGSLNTPRVGHTATLLPNGLVLLVGGRTYSNTRWVALNTAELYDPAKGSFSYTGEMATARVDHSATLLPNGKVLMAGGHTLLQPSAPSAEIYDPATGIFSAAGPMVIPRSHHTATLLPWGKILFTGGGEEHGNTVYLVDIAEVFDSSTNTFHATQGTPGWVWIDGMAAPLPGGRVLVMGGRLNPPAIFNRAAIYDPSLDAFLPTNPMGRCRASASSLSLSDGRVLVIGGMSQSSSSEFPEAVDLLITTEIYDPISGAFGPGPSLPKEWHGLPVACQFPNGQIFVTEFPSRGPLKQDGSRVAIFDGSGFNLKHPLLKFRWDYSLTLLANGKLLIAGGEEPLGNQFNLVTFAEVYDPSLAP